MSRWTRLVDWLHAPEPALWLGLVRVAVPLVAAVDLVSTWASGVHRLVWVGLDHGGYRAMPETWWFGLVGDSPATVEATIGLAVVALLGLSAGVGGPVLGRALGLVGSQGFLTLVDRNGHAGGSYDLLLAAGLWLLVLSGGTQTLSVHCWRRTGRWHDPSATAPRWTRVLVAWQVLVMYATTGWQKLSIHWVPGGDLSALYDILQQPTWSRGDRSIVAHPVLYAGTQVATLVTWAWEVLTPVWGAWWLAATARVGRGRAAIRLRRAPIGAVWLGLGLLFHALIFATMEVGPFTPASLSLYPAMVGPVWLARRLESATGFASPRGTAPPGTPAPATGSR